MNRFFPKNGHFGHVTLVVSKFDDAQTELLTLFETVHLLLWSVRTKKNRIKNLTFGYFFLFLEVQW